MEQLKEIADQTGWVLEEACVDSGIASTTYFRWKTGRTQARESEVIKVANYMETYAR